MIVAGCRCAPRIRISLGPLMLFTAALLALAVPGCGGVPAGGSGGASITARIDGQAWTGDARLSSVVHAQPGQYSLTALRTDGYTLVMSLHNIREPGRYALGVGISVPGGTAILSDLSGGWSTMLTGSEGTIDITELTDDRIAGTFSFTADALSGTAEGTLVLTDGAFDLPVNVAGTFGDLPDNAGSTLEATIDGAAWNAANIASVYQVSRESLVITASTLTRSVSIILSGFNGEDTYLLTGDIGSSSLGLSNTETDPADCCWGTNFGGDGEVVIETLTATRVIGSFSATLRPAPTATGDGELTVSGSFDIGLTPTP